MQLHLLCLCLTWLLSVGTRYSTAFGEVFSIKSTRDGVVHRTHVLSGAHGSHTATVGSWNHSTHVSGTPGTSKCACYSGTASGSKVKGACEPCQSAVLGVPASSRSGIVSLPPNEHKSLMSAASPLSLTASRKNISSGLRGGTRHTLQTAAPPFPTDSPGNLTSGSSGTVLQHSSAATHALRSSSDGNSTSKPVQTAPPLSTVASLYPAAIVRNSSYPGSPTIHTNVLSGNPGSKVFTASGMATSGSSNYTIRYHNTSSLALGTGGLSDVSMTLRYGPSSAGNSSARGSIRGTGSSMLTSGVAITSVRPKQVNSTKNVFASGTKTANMLSSVDTVVPSQNTSAPPSSNFFSTNMPVMNSTSSASNKSRSSLASVTLSLSATTVISISNTSLVQQQSQASPASTGQVSTLAASAFRNQNSSISISSSAVDASTRVSSLLNISTPTVFSLPIVETRANGVKTTITAPVVIGPGIPVVPFPVPIGIPFPGPGAPGAPPANGGPGEEPNQPPRSSVGSEPAPQSVNTETSNLPSSYTQTTDSQSSGILTSSAPSTMASSATASSTLATSTLFSSMLTSSTLPSGTPSSSTPYPLTSCSSCDICPTLEYNPSVTPDPLDNDALKRRLAGRFYNAKRAPKTTVISLGSSACKVASYTPKPDYPGPGVVGNNEPPATPDPNFAPDPSLVAFYATATYWAVPTQPSPCGAPGWTFLKTNELENYVSNNQRPVSWKLGQGTSNDGKRQLNIDHVYEVKLVNEFFSDRVSCNVVKALLDVPDVTRVGTRLNTIFAQLPSYDNPDFLGMDTALNGLKGTLWNANLRGLTKADNPLAKKEALSNLAVVMSIANNAKVFSLFESTNARIYQAFLGIDDLISQSCNLITDSAGSPISATFASAYQDWATSKIASQNSLITSLASSYIAGIPTTYNSAKPKIGTKNVNNWSSFISNFNAVYPTPALTFPVPSNWPTIPLSFAQATAACTLNPPLTTNIATITAPAVVPASTIVPPLASTVAVESLCFLGGNTENCYNTIETIPFLPGPTGMPPLTCLDDSDSEDCIIPIDPPPMFSLLPEPPLIPIDENPGVPGPAPVLTPIDEIPRIPTPVGVPTGDEIPDLGIAGAHLDK